MSDPDGADPNRVELTGEGTAVLAYTLDRQERPTANDALPLAPLEVVVPAVLEQLAGWWLTSSDRALVDALVTAGATSVRHSHLYSRPLSPADGGLGSTALPFGLAWSPIDRSPLELARLVVQANAPGHVDHVATDPAVEVPELTALLSGELVGPYLARASSLILADQRVVAAVIVNRSPGEPPQGGPWVSQVFRHPAPTYAGLGARALQRAMAVLAVDSETALSLAVTDGNPAERVYQRLGFNHVASRHKLAIPAWGPGPGRT
jgi:hypothetical protein